MSARLFRVSYIANYVAANTEEEAAERVAMFMKATSRWMFAVTPHEEASKPVFVTIQHDSQEERDET